MRKDQRSLSDKTGRYGWIETYSRSSRVYLRFDKPDPDLYRGHQHKTSTDQKRRRQPQTPQEST